VLDIDTLPQHANLIGVKCVFKIKYKNGEYERHKARIVALGYQQRKCLDPRRRGSARTCSLHCTLTPAACAARSARSAPGRDTRSGQGALDRRHTDGPLWAALLKTTVMCEAWRRTIAPPDPSRTSATSGDFGQSWSQVPDTDTGTGPIPPVTVSRVQACSGGVLARSLPEGLHYLST
jgi:hypothetical protein